MDQTKFFAKIEEILDSEPGSVSGESTVQDQEGWDSVAALSLIAMIDESYGVSLEGTEIFGCPTVGELLGLVEQRAAEA
jgi:acyl carrier protein